MHHHDHKQGTHSMSERIEKIIAHWIKHNDDHIQNYQDWSQKARSENMSDVSDILDEVAEMSQTINVKLKEAISFFSKT